LGDVKVVGRKASDTGNRTCRPKGQKEQKLKTLAAENNFVASPHLIVRLNRTNIIYKNLNSVAVVRKQSMPTERPPLVGEVSANLCG
jgi:hypothetical protein